MVKWSRYSPELLLKSENDLIQFSGVEIERKNICIGRGLYLHCLTCGDPSKPAMVLLHGYCGSGLIFFKILHKFVDKYRIYIVDHLGMGRSSRPEFVPNTLESAEEFFVEPLELFRKFIGVEKLLLVGHSFGGYISGCYALKYPQNVSKVLLLSPVGFGQKPKEFDFLKEIDGDWWVRFMKKFMMFFWVKNITPISLIRKCGPITGHFFQAYSKDRFNSLSQEENLAVGNYLEQINIMPGSGEYGLVYILEPGAWARSPLCVRFEEANIPLAFFFGDIDWVKPDGARQLKKHYSGKMLIYMISHSDHHLYWDNPEDLSEKMLEAIELLDN
ncbi:unnamed protein product [Blepharisma stoltei]|uniref:AB hydrolase-1 domain-containing protein n=1 Tax=Blepharisma stoltei TaxID=1481888 RepID=A0AAU9JRL7_9CILI|nr:unnamed protein product [Blepharisma stoltei]